MTMKANVIAISGNGEIRVKPAYTVGKVSLSMKEISLTVDEGIRGGNALVSLTRHEAEQLVKALEKAIKEAETEEQREVEGQS